MPDKCRFLKKNGSKCDADAQTGKSVCVFHDLEQSTTVERARRDGGIKRSRPAAVLPPDTPDITLENASEVSALITDSINQLRRGNSIREWQRALATSPESCCVLWSRGLWNAAYRNWNRRLG